MGIGPEKKIYVAGHRGLVGSALVRRLEAAGYRNLILRTHAELDLTQSAPVHAFLRAEKPEVVFLAAAKVGGILANMTTPADYIRQNLMIQNNVIEGCRQSGVRYLIFLGSSCIYPRDCPQPIKEDYLLTGPLEATNRPYAIAKIAGIEECWAYNRQYGSRYLAVMPTNLYGPGDNFDLDTSHVLPALIRKCHEAKISEAPFFRVWGTGSPRRELLYSEDMADACIFLMNGLDAFDQRLFSGDRPPLINIGYGEDLSIRELADTVAEVIDYPGQIEWDPSKPDGTPRKLLDSGFVSSLGWQPSVSLREGIRMTYDWYLSTVAGSR